MSHIDDPDHNHDEPVFDRARHIRARDSRRRFDPDAHFGDGIDRADRLEHERYSARGYARSSSWLSYGDRYKRRDM